ncbi:MAG: DUF2865 domain-containing protein [Hyphomicrobiales bacterium]|nr:DUF2865 domain-containing protein [Hyphomicrobiales bacterium]
MSSKSRLGFALCLAGALASSTAAAQAVDCNRLALQIAGLGRSGAPARAQDALARAQAGLSRLTDYGRSLGCDKPNFFLFGSRPPQCDGINDQIERLQANVAQLQRAPYGDPGVKQQLQNKYDTWCRDRQSQDFDASDRMIDGTPDQTYPPEDPSAQNADAAPSGGSMAVCVRTCDGGFFPVSYSARRSDLPQLQELCTALCPNAEVKVYTRSLSRDMHSAVSASGEPYDDLANAFKYEKTVDHACTCKPPGQTWAQALANAEQVLGDRNNRDTIVTPEMSAQMSRPKQAKSASDAGKGASRRFNPAAAQKALDQRRRTDAQTQAERAMSASAPSTRGDSSGADAGGGAAASAHGRRNAAGADGLRRGMPTLGD